MTQHTFVRFEDITLKGHQELNEKWVQERIAEDPSILGLGELILKDKERIQPGAGRLDLLLQDPDSSRRYEVEIQLGRTDESHIIRTIEYWDIERKRYPQYDHTGVIIAEDITSRFLNVISLFNGFIPLVAIQMNALAWEDKISLVFTTVLDQMTLGMVDEDEEQEVTDRAYWEKRGSKATVATVDKLLELIHTFDDAFELKYNKFYIGLTRNGQTNNFAIFRPRKSALRVGIRMSKSEELEGRFDETSIDLLDYNKWGRYQVRLTTGDVEKHREFLTEVLRRAYEESVRG